MTDLRRDTAVLQDVPRERDILRPSAVLAVCSGASSLAQVEHDLLDLRQALVLPLDGAAATHPVRDAAPHWAATLAVPPLGVAALQDLLARAAARQGAGCVGLFALDIGAGEPLMLLPEETAHAAHVATAAAEHLTATGGRLLRFPGQHQVTDEVTVAELLGLGCIDQVRVVGGGPVDDTLVLRTRRHLRPELAGGRVELLIERYDSGSYIPYERPEPHQCCALH